MKQHELRDVGLREDGRAGLGRTSRPAPSADRGWPCRCVNPKVVSAHPEVITLLERARQAVQRTAGPVLGEPLVELLWLVRGHGRSCGRSRRSYAVRRLPSDECRRRILRSRSTRPAPNGPPIRAEPSSQEGEGAGAASFEDTFMRRRLVGTSRTREQLQFQRRLRDSPCFHGARLPGVVVSFVRCAMLPVRMS